MLLFNSEASQALLQMEINPQKSVTMVTCYKYNLYQRNVHCLQIYLFKLFLRM